MQADESATSARDGFEDDVEGRVEHRRVMVRALDLVDDFRGLALLARQQFVIDGSVVVIRVAV